MGFCLNSLAMERSTRQRTAIRTVIDAAARPLTPQEILAGVRETVSEIGIATIYRNLKLLLDDGTIQTVSLPGENARYEMSHAAHHHHHHFHCVPCDRVFDVDGCPGPMDSLAPAGFVIDRHELTLYGVCADCAAERAAERAKVAPLPKRRARAPKTH
jgi:Fur family ferric uptake transcriptional regulator